MVYADYAATYPYVKYPSSAYGTFFNPNANYAYKEKRLLFEAENRVKKAIGAKGGKVVFGGTSSQLIANLMDVNHDCQVWCSPWEHDSFFRYTDANNIVSDLDELKSWLKIALPSVVDDFYASRPVVMWQAVQNITGEIFPVEEIGKLCHEHDAFYICDMTAMIGHVPIPANIDQWCDCAVWSGHKLGTELGIGAMWISDRLDEWLNGFKLHGTPNLAGALAMTQAVENACDKENLTKQEHEWFDLRLYLEQLFLEQDIEFEYVGELMVPKLTNAIQAIRLPGFNASALQQFLASKQVYIGLGQSSCADEADKRILCQGYGLSEQEADEVIRISCGENSSVKDVETLIKEIKNFKELYVK